MEYNWGRLPQSLYVTWMPYSQMFDEFAGELANSVNALTRYTHQLAAWRDVLEPLSLTQQLDAAVEFVDPVGTVALTMPYVIRSRFIFASAHLCHQANQARSDVSWKDDLPLDKEVWFETADKSGKGWKGYPRLKLRLEAIGAKNYQAATHDFRNTYNHRFSPRIVLGMTGTVTRHIDQATGNVWYGFGGTPALSLRRVVDLIEAQSQYCYQAFESFQKLVREHEAIIAPHNAKALKALES